MSARDSEVLERPAHVDPKHAIDYDIFNDPRFAAAGDPHAALRRLGEEAGYGIYWTPRNGGHWFINDYELIFQAARAPDLFSSKAMTVPPMPAELEPRLKSLERAARQAREWRGVHERLRELQQFHYARLLAGALARLDIERIHALQRMRQEFVDQRGAFR